MSGFLALPREVLDVDCRDAWFPHDLSTAMLYAYLVNKANWCDGTAPLPRQLVPLKTGQLVTSERDLAKRFDRGRMWVRSRLDRLRILQKIIPVNSPHGTVIEICNYKELFLLVVNRETTDEPTVSPQRAHAEPTLSPIKTKRQSDKKTRKTTAEELPGDSAHPVSSAPDVPVLKTPGSQVWEAYAIAYQNRYGQAPVRNAKSNALAAQLVSRLGLEAAVRVVEFYLTHRGSFYVQKVHPLNLCLQDAEALHTQMLAGYRVSSSEARRSDISQANQQTFEAVAAKLKAEGLL